jgi:hypothetical protein
MSASWQSSLLLTALSAVLAVGPSTNIARAQCNHGGSGGGFSPVMSPEFGGGFNPRMAQGLIAQQLMQQQQLIMQQQLLQQVQRQQQLQTAKLDQQMRELAKDGPDAIKSALQSPNPEVRLTAVLTIDKYGPALTDELIERLTDDNVSVSQAARRTLVKLSTVRNGKPNKARGVDFGPVANAKRSAQETAARKWRAWFDRLQKREADETTVAGKPARPAKIAARNAPLTPIASDERNGR